MEPVHQVDMYKDQRSNPVLIYDLKCFFEDPIHCEAVDLYRCPGYRSRDSLYGVVPPYCNFCLHIFNHRHDLVVKWNYFLCDKSESKSWWRLEVQKLSLYRAAALAQATAGFASTARRNLVIAAAPHHRLLLNRPPASASSTPLIP